MLNNDKELDERQEGCKMTWLQTNKKVMKICKEHWKNQTDNAEDAVVEVQDSTCHPKTNTCIQYVIARAQEKNSCRLAKIP